MQHRRARSSSPYLAHRRWTAEDARRALDDLEQSGLELRAFAIREGLDPQRLARWRRRLAGQTGPAFQEIVVREPATVVEMDVARSALGQHFEIVLTSGRAVRVPASFDAGALRQLLEIVEQVRSC